MSGLLLKGISGPPTAAGGGGGGIAAVSGQQTGNNANNASSVEEAFTSDVTAGNLIVVVGLQYRATDATFVTGSTTKLSGTATLGTIQLDSVVNLEIDANTFMNVGIWSAIVTGSGSLTMQVASAFSGAYMLIGVGEFTGTWSASRFEDESTGGTATDGVTAVSSGNCVSAGGALFVGGTSISFSSGPSIAHDGAWTLIYENEVATDHNGSVIFRIVESGTTDPAEWTIASTNTGWSAAGAVYKEG